MAATKFKRSDGAVSGTRRLNVKTGDTVVVLRGKDRGATGEVISASHKERTVTVAGINLAVRHQRARRENPFGQLQQGLVEKPMPLDASKVILQCPHCHKGTRAHRVRQGDGKLARVCRKCNLTID